MSVVYFIECVETGFVKIGKAACAADRLSSLQTGSASELRLLGTVPGGLEVERGLHRRFAGQRIRGEWFRRDDLLSEIIGASTPPAPVEARPFWVDPDAPFAELLRPVAAVAQRVGIAALAREAGVPATTVYSMAARGWNNKGLAVLARLNSASDRLAGAST